VIFEKIHGPVQMMEAHRLHFQTLPLAHDPGQRIWVFHGPGARAG
jgi:hypothetical protein